MGGKQKDGGGGGSGGPFFDLNLVGGKILEETMLISIW